MQAHDTHTASQSIISLGLVTQPLWWRKKIAADPSGYVYLPLAST